MVPSGDTYASRYASIGGLVKSLNAVMFRSAIIEKPVVSDSTFRYLASDHMEIDEMRANLSFEEGRKLLREVLVVEPHFYQMISTFLEETTELIEEEYAKLRYGIVIVPRSKGALEMAIEFLQSIAIVFAELYTHSGKPINPFATKFIISVDQDVKTLSPRDAELYRFLRVTKEYYGAWVRDGNMRFVIPVPSYHVGKDLEYLLSAVVSRRHIYLLDRSLPSEWEPTHQLLQREASYREWDKGIFDPRHYGGLKNLSMSNLNQSGD